MKITDQLASHGELLFRWRSYLPIVLMIPVIIAANDAVSVDIKMGPDFHHWWLMLSIVVSLSGLAIRWVTVAFVPAGTSGRNTTEQRAHQLNKSGVYSAVRNPLYLGNFIAIIGVVFILKVWWDIVITCLAYWLYIERIIATEEKFLASRFGDEYQQWAEKTPAFIPNFKSWVSAKESFSLRTLLRREYNGNLF